MRHALKNLSCNPINLEVYSQFYCTIKPYKLTDPLGSIIAILLEYNFTKKGDNNGQFSCKFYSAKEGNWYDNKSAKIGAEKAFLRMLKSAVDAKENDVIF